MQSKKFALISTSVLMWVVLSYLQSTGVYQPLTTAWAAAAEEEAAGPAEDMEVLTRGPIHEAFAQPVSLDSEEAFRISREPPAAIEEIPPEEKPEGEQVVWIPGYWSWDEDRDDFLWVSGCWRAVPPNSSWVPGYWSEVEDGYEWVAGFWTSANTEKIEYLPAPPETLEIGPPVSAPAADMIWVSGCWVWQPGWFWSSGHYAWRPGFWLSARTDWVWIPARYVYTPRGCVFVAGYWDYTLEQRGVAFLPVYWPARVYTHTGFRFSPELAIDVNILSWNLFCWPRHHHYYFGDYYAVEYGPRGIYPWHEAREHHKRYDPLYVHQQWKHRNVAKWRDTLRSEYEHRRNDYTARPARTYTALKRQVVHLPDKERRKMHVARPLKEVVVERAKRVRFETLDNRRREEVKGSGQKLRVYKEQRVKWESPTKAAKTVMKHKQVTPPKEPQVTEPGSKRAAKPGRAAKERPVGKKIKPHKVKVPKSPIMGSRKQPKDKEMTPPPKPKRPKVDTKVKPKSRKDSRMNKQKRK